MANSGNFSMPKITARTIVKVLVASLLVGMLLAALNIDPHNILKSMEAAFYKLADMGVEFFSWAIKYVLIGAVIVVPVWLISYVWRIIRNKK